MDLTRSFISLQVSPTRSDQALLHFDIIRQLEGHRFEYHIGEIMKMKQIASCLKENQFNRAVILASW